MGLWSNHIKNLIINSSNDPYHHFVYYAMEQYLHTDIIKNILLHLDRSSSFHLLNIAKFMKPQKSLLYEKYCFHHSLIKNHSIKPHIRHLNTSTLARLCDYENLKSLNINNLPNERFRMPIFYLGNINFNYLPKFLTSLTLCECRYLNGPLNDLPKALQTLIIINCTALTDPLKKLPKELKKLELEEYLGNVSYSKLPSLDYLRIRKHRFNRELTNLPASLKSLEINSSEFNKSLDNLPGGLHCLTLLGCHKFNQSIDNLPINLHTLYLSGCSSLNQSFDHLPENLHTFKLLCPTPFYQSIDKLPKNLHHLGIHCTKIHQSLDYLPINLHSLSITSLSDPENIKWPPKLYSLDFRYSYNAIPRNDYIASVSESIKILKINGETYRTI